MPFPSHGFTKLRMPLRMGYSNAVKGASSVLTGAWRGVGRALAFALGQPGTVALTHKTNRDLAEHLAAKIWACGGRATAICTDNEDPAVGEELSAEVERAYGWVDYFRCNAAVDPFKPMEDLRLHHLDRCHAAKTHAFGLGAQQAARLMDCGGRTVVMPSLGAGLALPRYAVMGAQKAALEARVSYPACEFAALGINMNAVSLPKQRVGTAQVTAHAAAFLLSDGADYITGQTLVVDGGVSVSYHLMQPSRLLWSNAATEAPVPQAVGR